MFGSLSWDQNVRFEELQKIRGNTGRFLTMHDMIGSVDKTNVTGAPYLVYDHQFHNSLIVYVLYIPCCLIEEGETGPVYPHIRWNAKLNWAGCARHDLRKTGCKTGWQSVEASV